MLFRSLGISKCKLHRTIAAAVRSLHVSKKLELVTESPKLQYLKTLTVGPLRCDENNLADITHGKSSPDGHGVHLEAEGIRNSINNEGDSISSLTWIT